MQNRNSILTVERLQKAFDEKVLDAINFTLGDGEILVVLGPNACGKTTLLKIIAGLMPPDYGEVLLPQGANGSSGMTVVFQRSLLLPWLTVEENICLPFRLSKRPRPGNDKLEALLQNLDLLSKRTSYPDALSGGEAQKVAIARALVTNPHVLLMDEPFSALDDHMRARLQFNLLTIQAETGQSILFVTHDLDEAILLADRVLVLSQKPTRIKDEIIVNLQRPRERNEPNFEAKVMALRRALLT